MVRRYANRKDANQGPIVDALREAGCSVEVMHTPCDLLVGIAGKNVLLELKDGAKPPSARKLTKDQIEFRKNWRGQFAVVETIEQAIKAVGL